MTEAGQSIEGLFSSLQTLREQRSIIGDTLDPAIAQLETRIRSQLTPPTDEQRAVVASWQTVLDACAQAGIDAPEPTASTLEALDLAERYDTLASSVGLVSIAGSESIESSDAHDSSDVPQADSNPVSDAAPAAKEERAKPKDTVEAKRSNRPGTLKIVVGEETIRPYESSQGIYERILTALEHAEEGQLNITDFVRELTGGFSSREIELMRRGVRETPDGYNPTEAKAICSHFYNALTRLRDRGAIVHIAGEANVSGVMKQRGALKRTEAPDGMVTIEVDTGPYKAVANLYNQTVINGRGKERSFNIEPSTFARAAEIIGMISVKRYQPDTKITRKDIGELTSGSMSPEDLANFTRTLRDVCEAFDNDLPLEARGTRGGAHFIWTDTEATFDIVDGWPEKPDFDDAAEFLIDDTGIRVIVNHQTLDVVDYNTKSSKMLIEQSGADAAEIIESAAELLEILGVFESDTRLSMLEVMELVGLDTSNDTYDKISGRFRRLARQVNEVLERAGHPPLVNWITFSGRGAYIDVNRRVTVSKKKRPELEQAAETAAPDESAQSADNTDQTEIRAPHKLSVQELLAEIDGISETSKAQIRGRLMQNGRYEYPRSLKEAGYLITLLTNKEVMAEVRESSRFSRKGHEEYDNFVAEALLGCYFRMRSWGEFEQFVSTIASREPEKVNQELVKRAQRFGDTTNAVSTERDQETRRGSNNTKRFSEIALTDLIDGSVPEPRNPQQAIALLDVFRLNRPDIAKGKTEREFTALVDQMHKNVQEVIGAKNFFAIVDSRVRRGTKKRNGRAIQTSDGKAPELIRTDDWRYTGDRNRGRGRNRKRRK